VGSIANGFCSKLTSLDDVRLEITLLAADPQKAGREKPKVVGQLAQSYRVLSLPKSGELCKPIWVPIYDVSVGAGESILGSGASCIVYTVLLRQRDTQNWAE
jgi:hypothetical protein